MRLRLLSMALVALLVGGVGQLRAGIIFSTLGPGDSYDGNNGYEISGPSALAPPSTGQVEFSAQFTPSVTAIFSEIELAISSIEGTNSAIIQLQNDNAGLPGSLIEGFMVTNLPSFGSSSSGNLVTAFSVLMPTLVAGTQYWVSALEGASNTLDAWNFNSIGQSGTASSSLNGGTTWISDPPNTLLPAFRVDSAVPEPTNLLLLAIGATGLIGYSRRRRAA
jgi:hypothetical protein